MASVLINNTPHIFFCILEGTANTGSRSRFIALAGVASSLFSFIPGFGTAVTVAGVYDAYYPAKTGHRIIDVLYPHDTVRRVSLSNTLNIITLFRYSLKDGLFRVQIAMNENLPPGQLNLSDVIPDKQYLTIFTKAMAKNLRLESYRAFELKMTPHNNYKPMGQDSSETDVLQDRCILSVSASGVLRKYLKVGTYLPSDQTIILGDKGSGNMSDRGDYLMLIQSRLPTSDPITSIELATNDPARPYVYLWILRGFTIRGGYSETSPPITPDTLKNPAGSLTWAKVLIADNLTNSVGSTYRAFDWCDDSTSTSYLRVQAHQHLAAVVRRKGYTAFVVLNSITTYHRFVPA